MDNFLLKTDSYKLTHWKQYPPGTKTVYSYLESRGGRWPATLMFGLQYYLMKYLGGTVFNQEDIDHADWFCSRHFGQKGLFNREGWQYILQRHDGRLPVRIKAVKEGELVPTRNVLMTIENTDERCYWLPNYLETLLLKVWYPITVATQSYYLKKLIARYLDQTGDPKLIDFKLHDFGYRGVSSEESAGLGAAAHLISFQGTDTVQGIQMLAQYYAGNWSGMAGFSIPAAEHSTMTAWGKDHEKDAYRNMLKQYPTGLVAVVSDSYDIFKAVKELWGGQLYEDVEDRDGTVVIRPDSGHPATVVLQVVELLADRFGWSLNEKGFRVLNPRVRVIQGDGINYGSIGEILQTLANAQWSADNVAFGMGGALLQQVHRDVCHFAFKASAVQVEDEWRDIYKKPATDPNKDSKAGQLSLIRHASGQWETVRTEPGEPHQDDRLQTVFENGAVQWTTSLPEIRGRLAESEKV